MRHNFSEIWRGVRANLPLLRGRYCVKFLLAKLIFVPPPDNFCTIPYMKKKKKNETQSLNFVFPCRMAKKNGVP